MVKNTIPRAPIHCVWVRQNRMAWGNHSTSSRMVAPVVENPDIAARLGEQKREGQLLVGFALETEHEQQNALGKMARKHLDYIVLNSLRTPGAGFATDTNCVTIFSSTGAKKDCPLATKQTVAQQILDTILFE